MSSCGALELGRGRQMKQCRRKIIQMEQNLVGGGQYNLGFPLPQPKAWWDISIVQALGSCTKSCRARISLGRCSSRLVPGQEKPGLVEAWWTSFKSKITKRCGCGPRLFRILKVKTSTLNLTWDSTGWQCSWRTTSCICSVNTGPVSL